MATTRTMITYQSKLMLSRVEIKIWYLRILKLADSPKLLTLHAARVVWVALDFLFSASDTSDGQSFPWLSSLCNTPMGIDNLAVDYRLAMCTIVVKVTHTFARNFSLSYKSWQELGTGPYLWSKSILSGWNISDNCTVLSWWIGRSDRCTVRRISILWTRF